MASEKVVAVETLADGHSRTGLENAVSGSCFAFCAASAALGLYSDGPAWARKMITVQYPNADGTFAAGPDDGFCVAFVALFLIVLRKIAMEVMFGPLADLMQVVKDKVKFKQQGWVFLYYLTSFTWGFIEIYGSPYWFDRQALWQGFPQTATMGISFKMYLVFQMAFWFHMVFVTLIEPWQHDFAVMIAHHVVTIAMLVGAYYIAGVRSAHAILVEQDLADIFLPFAKLFNYAALGNSPLKAGYQTAADVLFAVFAVVWFPTRHGILPVIYYSIWVESEDVFAASGCDCGQGNACIWAPERLCIIPAESWWKYVVLYRVLLGFFQVLLAIWLKELLLAIYNTFKGGGSVAGVEEASNQFVPELDTKKKD